MGIKMEKENKFEYFRKKMEKENIPSLVIDIFNKHYQKLTSGINTYISDNDIKPVENLPHLTDILEEYSEKTDKINKKTVIIKLNGGLGTGMGMECAKSLIKAKNDISFLEIIARQSMKNNQKLILMESFATYEDSKKTLDSIMPQEKEIARHFRNPIDSFPYAFRIAELYEFFRKRKSVKVNRQSRFTLFCG